MPAAPGRCAVVDLHLAGGAVMDLCHVVHLSDAWFAVQYFRDTESCAEMDLAFLPYELVTTVTVSLHNPRSRRVGFSAGEGPGPPSANPGRPAGPPGREP